VSGTHPTTAIVIPMDRSLKDEFTALDEDPYYGRYLLRCTLEGEQDMLVLE